ncbi:hypothetical protein [Nonomuraea candida]|uniref:hypothetical protein n=1 Tax=Nonomuraea candida TaxID=359159 RepID=UPI0005B98445|nr:hypothetical protein [Nonomuraea candida]
MLLSPRRFVAAAIVAVGLAGLAAPAAHAVIDPSSLVNPSMIVECATSAADLTALADPATLTVPPEIGALHCLQP